MADFCKQCAEKWDFPDPGSDMNNLCKADEVIQELCEECGPCFVGIKGECRGPCDVKAHWDDVALALLNAEKPNKKLSKRWENAR